MSLDGITLPTYFRSVRRMAIAFSTIFKNIWLVRLDASGNIVQQVKVPLDFGPKQVWYDRLVSRETLTDDSNTVMIGNTLPRMTFDMGNPEYDNSRQRNTLHFQQKFNTTGQPYQQLSPAPYNIPFTLNIYSKNMDDGLCMLEQILPMFQPQLNMKILEVPQLDVYNDVSIILNSVAREDNYLDGFTENRLIVWTLQFTVHGNIYPPYGQTSDLIYQAIINTVSFDDQADVFEVTTTSANATNPPDYNPANSKTTIVP